MRVRKFEGATMRDAIAKVKAELGDQAVIISTRQVRRGLLGTAIEISAAIDTDDVEPAPPPSLDGPSNERAGSWSSLSIAAEISTAEPSRPRRTWRVEMITA